MLSLSVKGMVDSWVVGGVEYAEMIDGNDEADPCLICLGPRPHQVTYHQDRAGPYLPPSVILFAILA